MANSYGKPFVTDNVDVTWAHLHKADIAFGNANHNITVVVTDELQSMIDDAATSNGWNPTKTNGIKNNKEGQRVLKVKNSQKARDGQTGAFPCVDANAQTTNAVAFGGDVVRVRLVPCLLDRDNSMSLYLEGVQIIDKKEYEGGSRNGFGAVEGGFDGSNAAAPEVTETAATTSETVQPEASTDLPF